jgi:biopolymer transport protein ExbB
MFQMGFREFVMTSPFVICTLLFFSVIMLAFALERIWFFVSEGKFDPRFWQRVAGVIRQGRVKEALALCEATGGLYAKLYKAGIESSHLSRTDVEDILIVKREEAQEALRRRLSVFGTFSFISPLLGLLGTVFGVIRAFHDLALSGSGGPTIMAAGISEALVATALGILVAVPSALLFNFFTVKVRKAMVLMNTYSQALLILLFPSKKEA